MTCDDKNNPSSEGFPPKRDLKRQLDSNEDQLSEKRLKTLITESSNLNDTSDLVHENNENDTKVTNKTRNVVPKHSRRRKKKLEIETEFKILQSLIPKIADKQSINEVSHFRFSLRKILWSKIYLQNISKIYNYQLFCNWFSRK